MAASWGVPFLTTEHADRIFPPRGRGHTLDLECAEEHGFQEVYTNDRHMLRAVKHFHVRAVDVLSESS
jgi:hypothetical protein